MISSVYKNKNRIPVDKQAVKEFFKDHEFCVDDSDDKKPLSETISINLFKKPTFDMLLNSTIKCNIDPDDYERVANALKKSTSRPYKINKLIRHIQYMSGNSKKKYAMLIINAMIDQRFMKIKNNEIIYY